jgi:arginyl-tRNA synthetase
MTFNPKESIDFNGNTGSFIQYTYARIRSILRKAEEMGLQLTDSLLNKTSLTEKEETLIQILSEFPAVIKESGETYSPALIANYIYDLVKEYNQFYHDYSILKEENDAVKNLRLIISANTAKVIKSGMSLLGIEVPERM